MQVYTTRHETKMMMVYIRCMKNETTGISLTQTETKDKKTTTSTTKQLIHFFPGGKLLQLKIRLSVVGIVLNVKLS